MKNHPHTPSPISSPQFFTSPPIIIIYIYMSLLIASVVINTYIKDLSYFFILVIFTISIYSYYYMINYIVTYELDYIQSKLSYNLFNYINKYLLFNIHQYVLHIINASVFIIIDTYGYEWVKKKRKQCIQCWTALCEVCHAQKRKHNNCYMTLGLYRRQTTTPRLFIYDFTIYYKEKLEIIFWKMVSWTVYLKSPITYSHAYIIYSPKAEVQL